MAHIPPSCSLFLLGREEAGALADLESECFSLPWSLGQYEKILPPQKRFLCRVLFPAPEAAPVDPFVFLPRESAGLIPVYGILGPGKALMAFLSLGLNRAAQEMEVYNIAVSPRHRRLGLARFLLAPVLNHAARHGFERAFLEVRQGNAPAVSLYSSLGFETAGRRKAYYSDNGEDALIMACAVSPVPSSVKNP